MKHFIFSAFLLAPLLGLAQTKTASLNGNIIVPSLKKIDVSFLANNFKMKFDNFNELDDGKEYLNAIKVHVKSNTPWIIKVRSNSPVHTSTDGNATPNIPASNVHIRPSGSGQYIPLNTVSQQVIHHTNTSIENDYYLDLKVNFDYNGNYRDGLYDLDVAFSISDP